jgi:hypothetical protein
MIDKLTRRDFEGLAPDALRVALAGGTVPLQVASTHALPHTSPRSEPFAVELLGPREPLLPQGTYVFEHPVHGRLELFMVPVGRDAAASRYELVFN